MNEQNSEFEALAAEAAGMVEAQHQPQPEPPGPPAPPTAEIILPVLSMVCDLAAPNWRIGEAEKRALAEAYGALLDKYFPDGFMAWGVELNAVIVTAAIIAPRMRTPRISEPEPQTEQAA